MLPNWNALLPYRTKKDKSFEQLCYQVAFKLFANEGILASVDDSGGGDGVEFYLKLKDQSSWGWQAKYYEGSPVRLNSSRKTKIKDSLKKSLEVHPDMCRWFLCVPMVLTKAERSWIETDMQNSVPADRQIEIIVWDEDVLHEFLNRPMFNGLKQAFFNELELSSSWFSSRFTHLSVIVEQKFDEDLYTENTDFFHWYVDPILLNSNFRDNRIAYYPRKLNEVYHEGNKALKKLNYTNEVLRPLFNYGIQEFEKINAIYLRLKPSLEERLDQLTANRIFETREEDYKYEIETINCIIREFAAYKRNWYQSNVVTREEKEQKDLTDKLRVFNDIDRAYDNLLEELKYYVSHSTLPLEWRVSHYLGNAGDGKTNFCVALARTFLQKEVPVIFIPAIKFSGDQPLQEQILRLLDIHIGYTFSDFLDTLNELGNVYNIRVPFILDGLNEAVDPRGHLNNRLALDLPAIEKQILTYKNIVLLTTCRPSYKEPIWGVVPHEDKRFHHLYGFTNIGDKKRLVRRYFEVYKIQADMSFISLEKFTKPLYLKIFCEATNPERGQIVSVTLGHDSIYTIFDQFLASCDHNVYLRLSKSGKYAPLPKYKTLASDVLKKISAQMWLNPGRGFDLEAMLQLADERKEVDYQYSVTKALLDEELLLIRNWDNGKDRVFLTYDMMSGYFIAEYLIDQGQADETFFREHSDSRLFGEDYEKLHPLHEDIMAALISLLPIRKGVFVHDYLGLPPHEGETAELFGQSIAITLMLSPSYITKEQILLISNLAEHESNLPILMKESEDVAFVSGHPFNFAFWISRIESLPMNLRDVYWSQYVGDTGDESLEDLALEFKTLQVLPSHSIEQMEKMDLACNFLIWAFTTTKPSIKQLASTALYEYALRYPNLFLLKYIYAAGINDPTVLEWMSATFYSALTTMIKAGSALPEQFFSDSYAFISSQILTPGSPHATNHIVTRNYNYSIIRLLERRTTNGITEPRSSGLKSDFKLLGIINWEEAEDRNAGENAEGDSLIDYYFNKERMPQIMVGKGDEYNRTPEYEQTQAKLRWRAYQLGYDFALFSEIDRKIARYHRFGQSEQSIYRYADKYIEIAHREYCGYLDGLGKFQNHEDIGYLRTFKVKHDPSAMSDLPEPDKRTRYIEKRFINREVSLAEWCSDGSVPEITEFLTCKQFGGKTGDFVLLNGELSETDKTTERQFFVLIDVVFVRNKDLKAARKAFFHKTAIGRGPEDKPSSLNVHQSEIPDAETIPHTDFLEWTYSLKSELVNVEYTRTNLIQKGKKLSEKKSDNIWNMVLSANHYMVTPRTRNRGMSLPMIQFTSKSSKKDDYKITLKNMGITLETEHFTKRERRSVSLELDVFIPVRSIEGEYYVCKNIIDHAGLSTKPGSTDLYDQGGKLAAFTHTAKIKYRDGENFTYLDKTILNEYLEKHELAMFWLIWGERDYYPNDGDWDRKPQGLDHRIWKKFYKSIEYNPTRL